MLQRFLGILCISVVLSGCSVLKVDSQDSTLDFYPPKASADQVSYLEKVEKPFEIIGIVSLAADRSRPFQDIIDQMKREAAILGGDAITDIRSDMDADSRQKDNRTILHTTSFLVHYSAKVIVLK